MWLQLGLAILSITLVLLCCITVRIGFEMFREAVRDWKRGWWKNVAIDLCFGLFAVSVSATGLLVAIILLDVCRLI